MNRNRRFAAPLVIAGLALTLSACTAAKEDAAAAPAATEVREPLPPVVTAIAAEPT